MEEKKYNFRLVAFNRWGYQCANYEYPNKTKAINEGRSLKRNGYAFSYIVYKLVKEEGQEVRAIVTARG